MLPAQAAIVEQKVYFQEEGQKLGIDLVKAGPECLRASSPWRT